MPDFRISCDTICIIKNLVHFFPIYLDWLVSFLGNEKE